MVGHPKVMEKADMMVLHNFPTLHFVLYYDRNTGVILKAISEHPALR